MHRVSRILVANRGEIAARIMRTAHQMGVGTVAVFSDADRDLPFVRLADQAVALGGAAASESYLRVDKLIAAAKQTGADAVHPGFGFLAENAEFAEACAAAGLTFIGPSAEAIRKMGSKKVSKGLVGAAGVPVIPGYEGDDQSTATLVKEALKIGFPVLVKASAGGGGKGMRVVEREADLEPAIEGAKREAKSSFGDDTLLIEKYITSPRHVEIQILGDQHGKLLHLFERECSIQRRHQKIIEETPSPALNPELRDRMGKAAVAVGKAVNYFNAGTVEFILDPQGNFYFLEVNTRLQVEHPITEAVTGVDIVREQIRVARGAALDLEQDTLSLNGAAVECRIYAEDPTNGFLPTTGTVVDFWLPAVDGLRIDAGIESGSEIGIHYDPMLAKVITWGQDRQEAIARMQRALSLGSIHGLKTNTAFLLRVLGHEEFQAGNTHTHFIQQHLSDAGGESGPSAEALAVATLALHEARRSEQRPLPALEPGFRNNRFQREWVELEHAGDVTRVEYQNRGGGELTITVGDTELSCRALAWSAAEHLLRYEFTLGESAPMRRSARVRMRGEQVFVAGVAGSAAFSVVPRFKRAEAEVEAGACIAPMPGKVVKLLAETGKVVEAGQVLVILEAMKMEHSVKAAEAGVVKEVRVAEGDQVEDASVLVVVGPADAD
ncbi:MAG: acetyl-CoA carboxylase biotin carboxylase subunit [Polyangiaceae bacterium]|nr:acetyl-CoA carboxylase biotin carboxylase subunit [Polyangiaceae bacterium]MCB9607528.1 acetyl-CoA carboxylase biotin carboxylase subunit [Polyangiaceae bacterium]